ncbi:MAG: hypothetical protein II877_10280 [Synergistaceae bacterium]|nr:hypothetical protein [Synergistaceae bacterium]
MITGQELEFRGDELELTTHINTDDVERENWRRVQAGKGFMYDSRGTLAGREIARIPAEEAAMLEAQYDIDYLSFSRNQDKNALRRLIARFPHWRCSEGGI